MSAMANVIQKKNKGRQKVKMARMEKDSNRQVTFSKRRCGLFKKASELCTLCGAEAAIIVFSPGKKAFSFGHPSVEAVVNRFLFAGPSKPVTDEQPATLRNINVQDLNMKLTLMNSRIEAEKKRCEELTEMRKVRGEHFWWDIPVEQLNTQQLHHLKTTLEELKQHVIQHGSKLMVDVSSHNNNAAQFVNPMVGFNHNNNPTVFNPNLGFGYNQNYSG